jgi:hypothetical protein
MPLFIRCPDCQKLLKIKEELGGKKVKCPQCGNPVRVPLGEPKPVIEEGVDLLPEAASPPSQDVALSAAEVILPDVPSRGTITPISDRNVRMNRPLIRQEPEEVEQLDEVETPVKQIAFPAVVTIAGMIWIFFGLIILLATFASLALAVMALANASPTTSTPGQIGSNSQVSGTFANLSSREYGTFCCYGLALLFGAVFLNVGIQSVRGRAVDTLGNGLGSFLFGLIFGGWGSMLLLAGTAGSIATPSDKAGNVGALVMLIVGGLYVLGGLLLLPAGLMALIGRGRYKAWRKAKKAARQPARR